MGNLAKNYFLEQYFQFLKLLQPHTVVLTKTDNIL